MFSYHSARHDRRANLFRLIGAWAAATSLAASGAANAANAFNAAIAPDIPPGAALSLEQAQTLAVARSRQIAGQDAAIEASRDMAVAAGQRPDPVLRLGIDNLPVEGADRGSLTSDFMTMRRVGVMQEITGSDKLALRSRRYEVEAQKNQAQKETLTAAVERDTAIAWLDLHYAEAEADAIKAQRGQAEQERQAVEAAYRGGKSSQADVLAARNAVALFDDRIDDAARQVGNARIMLARWAGDGASHALGDRPAIDSVRLDPAMLDTQLEHHPEIAVLVRQADIADAEAKIADAERKSDWTVEVDFQQRGPAYSNMVSVGLSIPLQWDRKHRQDRELSAKLAQAEQARAERDEMLRAHAAETRAMYAEWQTGLRRMKRYADELLPLARERSQAALSAYRGGKGTLADVLAAERGELDVRLSALQIESETARLWARLNFLFPSGHAMSPALAGESK
ncbi:MAG TPA: TolC family protein [Burkholderiaceae bacterium]